MKPSVLVVDDNSEIRDVLRDSLAGDYDIREASDGHYGLAEVMVGEGVDLVITDLKMPEVDGIELISNLPPGIPYIVISGFLQRPEFRVKLDRLAPAAVFQKPFEMASLRDAIQRTLAQ